LNLTGAAKNTERKEVREPMINNRFMRCILALSVLFALVLSFGCAAKKPMTTQEMLAEAKEHIQEISVAEAKAELDSGKAIFLDVREPAEWEKGHVPKAKHLPRGLLEFKIANVIPDKSARIVAYCKSGGRSCFATETLERLGYTDVASMAGGWQAWVKAGYPVE
jgi:rhodanese-related sulfurtransferase